MPTLTQSKYAKGQVAIATPHDAGAVVEHRFRHTLSAAPAVNDILELAPIPAGCRVIDVILDTDDLDSNGSPTIAGSVGIMSGDFGTNDSARTCGAEFFSASTLFQTGGIARPTLVSALRTTSADNDRSIGIKWTGAPATFVAGEIGLTVVIAAF